MKAIQAEGLTKRYGETLALDSLDLSIDPGEVYGIELCAVGGTHNVVGQQTWLPDHPSSFPKGLAATRNSGTTFPPSSPITPTYDTDVPWIEFGVAVSGTPAPHSPETRYFATAGSTTTIIPSWCNYIDRIGLGGGGGGNGPFGASLKGGNSGNWSTDTLTRGVDIPTATVILNITIGAGGAKSIGGIGAPPGSDGTSTTVTATGAPTLTATGGSGGGTGTTSGTRPRQ